MFEAHGRVVHVTNETDAPRLGKQFTQKLNTPGRQGAGVAADARDVASRPGQAVHQAHAYGVNATAEHDGYRAGCLAGRNCSSGWWRVDQFGLACHQFGGNARQLVGAVVGEGPVVGDVAPLGPAQALHFVEEGL